MNVLVTGVKGQLGFDVVKELTRHNISAIGVDIDEMDITNIEDVNSVLKASKCDVVVHCAAFTAVDKAEDMIETCRKVNVEGTRNIAIVCKELDIKMMYISTDYVFSGKGENEFETDTIREPQNVYGLSKADGEDEVLNNVEKYFIVRISWAFGINGNNFIKTMLKLGKDNGEVKVVNDQIGSPTYTYDLAKLLVEMIQTDKYGIYHATNEGFCSWYDFALEIFKQANLQVNVIPVNSDEFKVKAVRPKNSRLSKEKLTLNGFNLLPKWQDALSHYINSLDLHN